MIQIETGWLIATVVTIVGTMWGSLGLMAGLLRGSYEARLKEKDSSYEARLKEKDQMADDWRNLAHELTGTARTAVESGYAAASFAQRRIR